MPAYTWATGETITATKLNTLETEAWRVANQIAGGNSTSSSTTTSTSYVDGAASVTFTAKSTSVYAQVSGGAAYVTGNNTLYIGININSSDYTVSHCRFSTASYPFCGGVLVTGLTAGNSYTAKIRIRTSNASYSVGINESGNSRQTITIWDVSK